MVIRIVEGTLGVQGTVSGTDQTLMSLTEGNTHGVPGVLRVWIENPAGGSTVAVTNINTVTGSITLDGVDGNTVLTDVGNRILTVSGFEGAFLAASGSLQNQIDAIDSSVTLQEAYDNGTGVIQTTAGKPVVISGSTGEDFRVVGSGTFTEALTVGTGSTYLNDHSITTASGIFTDSLTVSGIPANIIAPDVTNAELVTVSGYLQSEIDSINIDELEDAIIGTDGIAVISGSNSVTVSGFLSRLNSTASGTSGARDIGFATVSGFSTTLITNPVSPSVQSAMTFFHSAGVVGGGTLSDLGNETVLVTSGIGVVRTQGNQFGQLVAFGWLPASGIPVPSGTVRYIGVSYDSFANTATVVSKASDTWNFFSEFPLGFVSNREGSIHTVYTPQKVGDGLNLVNQRLNAEKRIQRDNFEGGLILSETGTRNITLSAGAVWIRLDKFSINAIDTSAAGEFTTYYRDGLGDFVKTENVTQWPNTEYDDGSGTLATMTNNRYAVLWFYVEVDGHLSMLYGRNEYTSVALAEQESPPNSVPIGLDVEGLLVSRLIFQKNAAIASSIQSTFETVFATQGVTDHGDLVGLLDDDHTQYSLVDGTRAFTGTVGGITPVASSDLATKGYVDSQDVTISGHLQSQIDDLDSVYATDVELVSVSGHLQSEIDSINVDELEPAIVGTDGITVISGASTTTVSGFYAEFVAASGTLDATIDSDVAAHAADASAHHIRYAKNENDAITGSDGITITSGTNSVDVGGFYSEFTNASGSLQFQIDSINIDELEPAIVGTDGITVISGANITTVSGFYEEFTNASGTLQSQISQNTSDITDNSAEILTVSGHLQTQIDAVEGSDVDSINSQTGDIIIVGAGEVNVTTAGTTITVSGTPHTGGGGGDFVETALLGADGITIISGTDTVTVSGFRDEFVNTSGSLQSQIDTNSDHGNLSGLSDDDHSIYALLAGRSGGQTLTGGTAGTDELILRGSSSEDLGVISIESPIELRSVISGVPSTTSAIKYSPTYAPDSGPLYLDSPIKLNPNVSVNQVGYVYSAIDAGGIFDQLVAPNSALSDFLLFNANATLTTSGSNEPLRATLLNAIPNIQNDGGGAGVADVSFVKGVSFKPVLRAENSGDRLGIAELIGVEVGPRFNTVAGSTIDMGIVHGLKCINPAVVAFGSAAGTEELQSYRAVTMENITQSVSGFRICILSELAADTQNFFLLNNGGARSQDSGEYAWLSGGQPKVEQDGVGLMLGASDDIEIAWQSTDRLTWKPQNITAPWMGWFWNDSFNYLSAGQESGFTWGLRYQFDRFSWGAGTVPDPTSTRRFFDIDPPERTPIGNGDWTDFFVDSTSNNILVNALTMSGVQSAKFNMPAVSVTSGFMHDLSTLRVDGMGTEGIRNQGLWVDEARARIDGRMNYGAYTPAQITGDQNNYPLASGTNGRTIYRMSTDGAHTITGIQAIQDGDYIIFINVGSQSLSFSNEDASSLDYNRIITAGGSTATITANEMLVMWYDGITRRWRVLESTILGA